MSDRLEMRNVYITSDHMKWLRAHPEFNLSGAVRNLIDKKMRK